MTDISKRGLLQSGGLMTAGALLGCATSGTAASRRLYVAGPTCPSSGRMKRSVRRIYH